MISLNFLKIALKDYKVAAVAESSKHAVKAVMAQFDAKSKYVVEYGPGNGVITRALLAKMPKDGMLFVIELVPDFIPELNAINDARLKVVQGDVSTLSGKLLEFGVPHIDTVVSGIPFSFFNKKTRETVIKNTHVSLRSGGVFLVYQFSLLIRPLLKKYFRSVSFSFEPRNVPPYFVMRAEK